MTADAGFLKDANKRRIEVHPSTAAEAVAVIKAAYGASPDVVAKARAILLVKKKKKK